MANRAKPNSKRYKQGYYMLTNKEKYMGDPSNIVYRSSWELAFMKYCDVNERISKWNSEGVTITYKDLKGKSHRYYPDFYYELIDPNDPGRLSRVLVEIKPYAETIPPKRPLNESMSAMKNYNYACDTYIKNRLKWDKADVWCQQRDMKFIVVTEHVLKKLNLI
jgi:hypothetical protein